MLERSQGSSSSACFPPSLTKQQTQRNFGHFRFRYSCLRPLVCFGLERCDVVRTLNPSVNTTGTGGLVKEEEEAESADVAALLYAPV